MTRVFLPHRFLEGGDIVGDLFGCRYEYEKLRLKSISTSILMSTREAWATYDTFDGEGHDRRIQTPAGRDFRIVAAWAWQGPAQKKPRDRPALSCDPCSARHVT